MIKIPLFNISALARTTATPLIVKTRRNAQKCGYCAPETGRFCVAGLLSEWQDWFQPVNRLKLLFLPELP